MVGVSGILRSLSRCFPLASCSFPARVCGWAGHSGGSCADEGCQGSVSQQRPERRQAAVVWEAPGQPRPCQPAPWEGGGQPRPARHCPGLTWVCVCLLEAAVTAGLLENRLGVPVAMAGSGPPPSPGLLDSPCAQETSSLTGIFC